MKVMNLHYYMNYEQACEYVLTKYNFSSLFTHKISSSSLLPVKSLKYLLFMLLIPIN